MMDLHIQKEWETNFDEVVSFIKEICKQDSDWIWALNSRCKYVELRIDTRDGGFVIKDRSGERITFEELKYQNKSVSP